jgi:hypothetical protein
LIPLAISLGSTLAGGLANRGGSTPQDLKGLRGSLINSQMRLNEDPNLTGYQANQTEGINQNYDIQRKRLQELLAARGVSGPSLGFAESNLDRNRFSDITKLQQSIPLLARSLRTDAISSGGNLMQSLQGSSPQQGNVGGGMLGNLTQTLAYLYGQGAFSPTPKPEQQIH